MIIQCDVDSVLAEIEPVWLDFYNKDYNDNMMPEDWACWDIHTIVKPECGIKIYGYLERSDFYDNVKVIEGALEGVKALREIGRVVFVTSGIQPAKARWLHRNGFLLSDFPFHDRDIVVATDKTLIKGDILIDDRDKNCAEFSGMAICFNQPWNQNYYSPFRAYNWNDVLHLVRSK